MVIGGHMVFVAAQRVGQGIVAHVYQEVKIRAADGLQDHSLCFPGAEARHLGVQQITVSLVAGECQRILVLAFSLCPPFYQLLVYFFAQRFTSLEGDHAQ